MSVSYLPKGSSSVTYMACGQLSPYLKEDKLRNGYFVSNTGFVRPQGILLPSWVVREMQALVVIITSLNFTGRGILKCQGSNGPNSTEQSLDHNFGQTPNPLKMLSLQNVTSYSQTETDFSSKRFTIIT